MRRQRKKLTTWGREQQSEGFEGDVESIFIVWKWPDPRESSLLELFDGQKVNCRPACLLITTE
jgi:hypothetical protein